MIVMAMAAAMMCGCSSSMNESEEEPEWGGAVAFQSVTFDVRQRRMGRLPPVDL